VAARLEPKDATSPCALAATTLGQVLAKTTDPSALSNLARGLSAVAARLEPKDVDHLRAMAAATLSQVLAKTDAYLRVRLAEGLAALLSRVDPPAVSRRAAAAVAAGVILAGSGHTAATPVLLGPALEPLPCRFSTPELVELLKQPTCVGRARRKISTTWRTGTTKSSPITGTSSASPRKKSL
jgi:hypothetical protein